MRTVVRNELLFVKRSPAGARHQSAKGDELAKWKQCPVALFCEGGRHWLVVFADQYASTGFFASTSNGPQMGASEVSTALRARGSTQVRSIIEILVVTDIETCDEGSKLMRKIPGSNSSAAHCVDLEYNHSPEKLKKMRLRLASETLAVVSDWVQALKSAIAYDKRQSADDSELYGCFQPQTFPVKLIGIPENCPDKLGLKVSSSYKLLVDSDAYVLLSNSDSSRQLTRWPYTRIRKFGLPSKIDDLLLWFESGSKCETGVGEVRFHAADAALIHQLVVDQREQIKKALVSGAGMQRNSANPDDDLPLHDEYNNYEKPGATDESASIGSTSSASAGDLFRPRGHQSRPSGTLSVGNDSGVGVAPIDGAYHVAVARNDASPPVIVQNLRTEIPHPPFAPPPVPSRADSFVRKASAAESPSETEQHTYVNVNAGARVNSATAAESNARGSQADQLRLVLQAQIARMASGQLNSTSPATQAANRESLPTCATSSLDSTG